MIEEFEGTLILEKLATLGQLEIFYKAVDEDNFDKIRVILKRANIKSEFIEIVLKKIEQGENI